MQDFTKILKYQQTMFATGRTKNIALRIYYLRKLDRWINNNNQAIMAALRVDLNKPPFEAQATEIGIVQDELKYAIRHIRRLAKPKIVLSNIKNFLSYGRIYPEPYGVALIISPWNYPFMLAITLLISAIAAGNCAIVKPSEIAPATAILIARMCAEVFHPSHVCVVEGDRNISQALLKLPFNKIFFTGSAEVGREVMEAAAKNLVPVTLELGGKSPCIVDQSANIKLAAKRIIWGKLINAGQTCVAPDYVLVHASIKNELINEMIKVIRKQYGSSPTENRDYPKIINERHFQRLCSLMDGTNIVHGGNRNPKTMQVEPTIIDGANLNSSIMKEEIFGPILLVLTYSIPEDVVKIIRSRPSPLALYLFTTLKAAQKYYFKHLSFGGGCVNDTVVHLSVPGLPFGGVGQSGMGSCHGKAGFDTFTHYRSVLHKSQYIDIPLRYPPYSSLALKILKLL